MEDRARLKAAAAAAVDAERARMESERRNRRQHLHETLCGIRRRMDEVSSQLSTLEGRRPEIQKERERLLGKWASIGGVRNRNSSAYLDDINRLDAEAEYGPQIHALLSATRDKLQADANAITAELATLTDTIPEPAKDDAK